MEPGVQTTPPARSPAIKRRVSTLHRESEITLETPVSAESQSEKMNDVAGCMEAARHPLPKNEFERRLLLAKKGRKVPLPDISQIE